MVVLLGVRTLIGMNLVTLTVVMSVGDMFATTAMRQDFAGSVLREEFFGDGFASARAKRGEHFVLPLFYFY